MSGVEEKLKMLHTKFDAYIIMHTSLLKQQPGTNQRHFHIRVVRLALIIKL